MKIMKTSEKIITPSATNISIQQGAKAQNEKSCTNCKLSATAQNPVHTYTTITAKPILTEQEKRKYANKINPNPRVGEMDLCEECFGKLGTLTKSKDTPCVIKDILEYNGYQLNSCSGKDSRQVKIDGEPSEYYEFACPNHYQQAVQTHKLKAILLAYAKTL
ncbi:MAG: hypothetical protein RLZZ210_1524 [Pseudomonadota bacterium]